MGVEGAGASAARAYQLRVQRSAVSNPNPFYVNDGWDYPISQSNRHLLLHPNQVMVENPYYARMMAEVQAEETYFRQLRAAGAGRSIYEETVSQNSAPSAAVNDAIILENMLVQSARASVHQFGAVGQAMSNANANRPRAVDMEVASVSSEDVDDNADEEEEDDEEVETETLNEDQELLDAIASVKMEMLANNEEIKALQKKVNKPPPAEKKVDSTEKIPSTFRWVHIEIV